MSIHPDPNINRLNVLGEPLASCCFDPITGYFRNGFCHTAPTDLGQHTVCAQMTSEFLNFSQKIGNEKAKEVMGVIFGVYDMRLGDAHPTSSQIQESLKLAKIDSSLSYLKQGEQLISNYGQAILQIGKLLFGEKPR